MNAAHLLDELQARGATVTPSGDGLDIEAPRGVLTPQVLAAVKAHKPAMIALLAAPKTAPASTCGTIKRVSLPNATAAQRDAVTPESLAIASKLLRKLRADGAVLLVSRRAGNMVFFDPRLCVEWRNRIGETDWAQVIALRAELQKLVSDASVARDGPSMRADGTQPTE